MFSIQLHVPSCIHSSIAKSYILLPFAVTHANHVLWFTGWIHSVTPEGLTYDPSLGAEVACSLTTLVPTDQVFLRWYDNTDPTNPISNTNDLAR